jgi:hypothetical protein
LEGKLEGELRIFFDTNVVVEVEKNKIGFISILSQA